MNAFTCPNGVRLKASTARTAARPEPPRRTVRRASRIDVSAEMPIAPARTPSSVGPKNAVPTRMIQATMGPWS